MSSTTFFLPHFDQKPTPHTLFLFLTSALSPKNPTTARVVDLSSESVVDVVMQETGGMGVECVLDLQQPGLDYGTDRIESDDSKDASEECHAIVSKSDIIRCLSVHGRWSTFDHKMQVSV